MNSVAQLVEWMMSRKRFDHHKSFRGCMFDQSVRNISLMLLHCHHVNSATSSAHRAVLLVLVALSQTQTWHCFKWFQQEIEQISMSFSDSHVYHASNCCAYVEWITPKISRQRANTDLTAPIRAFCMCRDCSLATLPLLPTVWRRKMRYI